MCKRTAEGGCATPSLYNTVPSIGEWRLESLSRAGYRFSTERNGCKGKDFLSIRLFHLSHRSGCARDTVEDFDCR